MTEDKKPPFYWNTVSKIIYAALIPAITTFLAVYKGDWEDNRIAERITQENRASLLKKKLVEDHREDSIRLSLKYNGYLNSKLEAILYRSNTIPPAPAVIRLSVMRWYRRDPFIVAATTQDLLESYNTVQIVAEWVKEEGLSLETIYGEPGQINFRMPGTKEYLSNIIEMEHFFVYTNYNPTEFMSTVVPSDFRDWYFNAGAGKDKLSVVSDSVDVAYTYYLGETKDLQERWFLICWLDSADHVKYGSTVRRAIKKEGDRITHDLFLEK